MWRGVEVATAAQRQAFLGFKLRDFRAAGMFPSSSSNLIVFTAGSQARELSVGSVLCPHSE